MLKTSSLRSVTWPLASFSAGGWILTLALTTGCWLSPRAEASGPAHSARPGSGPASSIVGVALPERKPNIVYILADDLGWGEVGTNGQEIIQTPHIDRLAAEGMRFTQHYSGSPVCAPSRCVLMTSMHTGHSYVRGNKEMGGWGPNQPEGQLPLPASTITLAERLKEHGYATGAVGKWGLGGPGSTGHPCFQGFDFFYGLLCQRVAHNFYPTHLWRNHDVDVLDGNRYFAAHQKISRAPSTPEGYARYEGEVYAPDRMIEEAVGFIDRHASEPFFLYFPSPVPHVALQVPEDSLEQYKTELDEAPYLGNKGYLPHPQPRAAYAAMVTRFDRDIGLILQALEKHGVEQDTIVMFSSDNGPTYAGGADSDFFESAGPYRGLKGTVYEGGLRVPMIVRWPGRVAAASESAHASAFQDVVPTMMELIDAEVPEDIDGISFAPTLTGEGEQRTHEHMYWEYPEADGQMALRAGRWKLVRRGLRKDAGTHELFDIDADPGEKTDLSEQHPEVVARLKEIAKGLRTRSEHFPLAGLDQD
ncbi:MAG: arylsulfatase A [Planctomycetota bacterium]|jgi:arylsulfatase A